MHYSVEMLVRGQDKIVKYYEEAAKHWREIWAREDALDLAKLAKMLTSEQMWFEDNCGGRWVGQEVMVVSGLVGLYSTEVGFDGNLEKAHLLYDAFQTSFCSIEVKSIAEEVARSYDLLNASQV